MNILLCHNYYTWRSGEAQVMEREADLLRSHGHRVDFFTYDNADVEGMPAWRVGPRTIHSFETLRRLGQSLASTRYDMAHVHNTWLLMSPSVYGGLWRAGVPVVKTIHNFRWLCPVGTFYRDGRVCHDCVNRRGGVVHGILHRCYRGNLIGSALASLRLFVNRDLLRAHERFIDIAIVQNQFVKGLIQENGYPQDRLEVKGNFFRRPDGVSTSRGNYLIFYGRHESEKGLETLLSAIERTGYELQIFGQGPRSDWLREQVIERAALRELVQFQGYAPRDELEAAIAGSRAIVFPSEWYESFPLTIVEGMAFGKPVIASNLGSMPSIIDHERNGLLFRPGDPQSLADQMRRLWSDEGLLSKLERGANEKYEREMTPQVHYDRLMAIYEKAAALNRRRRGDNGR